VPLTNALFTSSTSAALNYPRLVITNGDRGSSQIPGAQVQHPTGSFVTANIFFVETSTYHNRGQEQHLPGAPPLTSSLTSVVAATEATDTTSQGPTIDDFFNFIGGYCRSYRQHLPGGQPSTSSTLAVAAAGATSSTSQGVRHRHLL
jgi:hypothetical protein